MIDFGFTQSGVCKYCSLLNLDLDKLGLNPGTNLDKYFKKSIKSNDEYAKIITTLQIQDTLPANFKQDAFNSLTLNKNLLVYLPNLSNVSIKNVKINQIDEEINKLASLKNIELVNNCLVELKHGLFTVNMPLTQMIIDNNPIQSIPASLFQVESLRSIIVNRLRIENLPDDWYAELSPEIFVRSIHIAQTKLRSLPRDLIVHNASSLEQLTFQGVHLILPENENQWSYTSVDLNRVLEMYCPNLLTVEEATQVFNKFDHDKNNILDFKELQGFNAYVFKNFPRAGENDAVEQVDNDNADAENMPSSAQADFAGITPKMFFICNSLTYLDLSFQGIRKLPGSIKMLRNLKVLKLVYCVYLESLSAKLGLLSLNELDLTGCISLKTPPLEIQKRGVGSVLAYLKRLLTGSVQCKRTKLMLQGLGGAGKTSLMIALLKKIYQSNAQAPPDVTDGISIHDWKVNYKPNESTESQELLFSVFDFAGQVIFLLLRCCF